MSKKEAYCTGDRQELINISCSSELLEGGKITSLINGQEENSLYFHSNREQQWILFDFKNTKICINSITWKQNGDYTQGQWQLQGSNNNEYFVNIGKSFTLNNGIFTVNNSTSFKYYKLQQINGQTTRSAWIYEIEFGIKTSTSYFLLEQDGRLYTIQQEWYDNLTSQYKPITGVDINKLTDEDLKKYGFNDIGGLLTEVIVNGMRFKPIDQLKSINNGCFNILVKELDDN